MQINAHFTDDDYVAFRLFYNQYDARNRRLILFNRSRALLVSAIFVLLFVYLGYEKSFILIESAILGLLSLLWFFFYPSYFIFMVRRSIKKMKKKGTPLFSEQMTYDFKENEIVSTTDTRTSIIPYSSVKEISKTADCLYIHLYENSLLPLPLRFIENPDALIDLINQKKSESIA